MKLLPYTVCVVDTGLFQPLAHVLSKQFERVLYWREWRQGYPKTNDIYIGENYPDIECIDSLFQAINSTDLFIFPDIYFAPEQKYLRSIGKLVFGSGASDSLEMFRDDFTRKIKDAGLPVVPHVMVKGIKKLREYLEHEEDKYIKVSFVRGLMETWHFTNYKLDKPKIDEIEHDLGCLSEEQDFMVQDCLEAEKEVGSDQIVVDGMFPKTVQFAVEGKDKTCLSRMMSSSALPQSVRFVNDRLHDLLKPVRGFFSSEIRVGKKDHKPYFTDPTMRCASPCGETYISMCENIGEMILGAAQGEIIEPVVKEKFAAQALITSDMAETANIEIFIDPKVRDNVFLYHSGIKKSDGHECICKTDAKMQEIGSVIGKSNISIDDAIKKCKDNAKGIECCRMSICTDALDEFKKDLIV
jgi:hypothetical protein